MVLLPARVRELRERAEFSRPQLAQRSRISLRQIARIESGPDDGLAVRDSTGESLARALDVEPEVLEGVSPMPAPSYKGPTARQAVHFDLIKRRYGITQAELFRAAPLMFVLLAEGSLLWRREVAEKTAEITKQLWSLNGSNRGYVIGATRIEEAVGDELESVEEGDLRGTDFYTEGCDQFGYEDDHAFREYLGHLVKVIGKPGTVQENASGSGWPSPLIDALDFDLLNDDMAEIVGDPNDDELAGKARLALWLGDVRITNIPEELWQDENAGRRARWIVDNTPEDKRGPGNLYDLDLGGEAGDDKA